VVGQFALKYLNNKFLHAGYRNYALHKTTIANKLNHAETRIAVLKTFWCCSTDVGSILKNLTLTFFLKNVVKEKSNLKKIVIEQL